ncbi:MAG TPA: hypothetical protein VLZ83_06880 [Edaphocola sp.]|nr:hypothetical protein [Edaphocola sp.]
MKFGLAIIICIILAYVLGLFLPWWSIAIAGFITALFFQKRPFFCFLQASIGVSILWFGLSIFQSLQNENLLTEKIGALFGITKGAPIALPIIIGILGGFIAGLGGLIGGFLFYKKPLNP